MSILSPAQQKAYEGLLRGLSAGNVLLLKGRAGAGKTTILKKLQGEAGGVLIGMREFIAALKTRDPYAVEEAFLGVIEQAFAGHELVIVDDLQLLHQISDGCYYPREYLLDAGLTALLGEAASQRKKLVFGTNSEAPWPVKLRAFTWEIGEFQEDDYRAICDSRLGEVHEALDYGQIRRFAQALTAHQLCNACDWLAGEEQLNTETFIDYLRTFVTSNVDLEEVEQVSWSDLKGVDAVIQELEMKIALPFENDELRKELALKPKRGVLLAGPPGTGKTTIGRALAHRLKSKFFLIDGTVIAGTGEFYSRIDSTFDAAKRNAPSIVFIDDADVLFEDEENRGFYRYLLTLMDGLESASSERVCVMMTAMHPGSLPAAMLRSGRVELWLETTLPDEGARCEILRDRLSKLPPPLGATDVKLVASQSQGLTGADLRNVVEDAKLLFAGDRLQGRPTDPVETYFLQAIETVRENRRKYAGSRPPRLVESVKVGFCGE